MTKAPEEAMKEANAWLHQVVDFIMTMDDDFNDHDVTEALFALEPTSLLAISAFTQGVLANVADAYEVARFRQTL